MGKNYLKSDIMKLTRLVLSLLILSILLLSIGAISAEDSSDLNINNNNINEINDISEKNIIQEKLENSLNNEIYENSIEKTSSNILKEENIEKTSSDILKDDTNTNSSEAKTWIVNADSSNPNQVLNPTIQPIINQANAGDTIILNGTFTHCRLEINKTLNIVAGEDLTLSPCPHNVWPTSTDMFGILHISEGGSGSTLEGLKFANLNYNLANVQQNPYAVFIDGANDVLLKDLNINWTGEKVAGSDKNPQDYIFNPILIKNSQNVTLEGLFINNTLNGIRAISSKNINVKDSTIANSKEQAILSDMSEVNSTNNIIYNDDIDTDNVTNGTEASENNTDIKNESEESATPQRAPKTWHIYYDKENPNQVLNPTVQPILDQTINGDTVVLHGLFIHSHFEINKTLTIIAAPGTIIGPCPHHQWPSYSGMFGIFHISEGGSGTVIKDFVFMNDNYNIANEEHNPFAIYIDGAKDVVLENLTINWTGEAVKNYDNDPEDFIYNPILIKNSENITLKNSFLNHTLNGIRIVNSSNVLIEDNTINFSRNAGILLDEKSSNIQIIRNNITESNTGINISYIDKNRIQNPADNITILNNIIKDNSQAGVYINTNITKVEIKGNYFISNGPHGVHLDYNVKNLNNDTGDNEKTIIDDNLFTQHDNMIVHHTIFLEDSDGDYNYNEKTDSYVYVGSGNGSYSEDKGYNYLQNALVIKDLVCGHSYINTSIPWDMNAPANDGKYNYSLKLQITQDKIGVYKLAICDNSGNLAKEFNNFNVIFYLNDYDNNISLQDGEVYKRISLENGQAIADFRDSLDKFKTSNNTITAVLEGISDRVDLSPPAALSIKDSEIPNNENIKETSTPTVSKVATKLTFSKLTTYPISGVYFKVKLTTSAGKVLANKKVSITISGKTYSKKTDKSGIVKLTIRLVTRKTYKVTVKFAGDSEYKAVTKTGSIVIKTGTKKSKITSSNLKIKRNVKKTYSFKLLNANNNAIKSAKVRVTINKKTYTLTTSSKGIAKLSIKIAKKGTYKTTMKFLGNSVYKPISKTSKIVVTS